MKKIFLFIFIIFNINTYSITKIDTSSDINVKLNDKVIIELSDNKQKSNIDSFSTLLSLIKDILTVLGILIGGYLGYTALFKNLKFDNLKEQIKYIQEKQKEVHKSAYSLFSDSYKYFYGNTIVTRDKIQQLFDDTVKLDKLAYDCTREIATLTFLLKNILQKFLKYYDYKKHGLITSDFYNFYLDVLNSILIFSIKVISFPSIFQSIFITKKINLFNKKIDKYTKKTNYKILNFIELGTDSSPHSKIVIHFYDIINSITSNYCWLLYKSFYRILNSTIPIARILYNNEIYFPIILKSVDKDMLNRNIEYFLIGYRLMYSLGNEIEKYVELYYITEYEHYGLPNNFGIDRIKDSEDKYINNKKLKIFSIISCQKKDENVFEIKVKFDDLKKYFKANKKLFEKKMKLELKQYSATAPNSE